MGHRESKSRFEVLAIEPCCRPDAPLCKCLYLPRPFALVPTSSLADGLRVLASRKVDLVILDISLPDSQGIDTYLRLKREHPHVPVVILTDVRDESIALESLRQGAQEYILKEESTPSTLAQVIRHAWARQQLVGALEDHEAREHFLATHDPLTGLANRVLLEEYLGKAVAGSIRSGNRLAVMFMDVDGFKIVNDKHGHRAGDAVLRIVAHRMAKATRRSDILARIGGDEFVAVLTAVKAANGLKGIAAQVRKAVALPIRHRDETFHVGLSVGISLCPEHGRRVDELIAKADIAMYQAKHRSGSKIVVYEPKVDTSKKADQLRTTRRGVSSNA